MGRCSGLVFLVIFVVTRWTDAHSDLVEGREVERKRERERESTTHRSHIELGLAGASSDKEARSHTRRSYTAKVISMNAAGG